jgi:hypothetical protein
VTTNPAAAAVSPASAAAGQGATGSLRVEVRLRDDREVEPDRTPGRLADRQLVWLDPSSAREGLSSLPIHAGQADHDLLVEAPAHGVEEADVVALGVSTPSQSAGGSRFFQSRWVTGPSGPCSISGSTNRCSTTNPSYRWVLAGFPNAFSQLIVPRIVSARKLRRSAESNPQPVVGPGCSESFPDIG